MNTQSEVNLSKRSLDRVRTDNVRLGAVQRMFDRAKERLGIKKATRAFRRLRLDSEVVHW